MKQLTIKCILGLCLCMLVAACATPSDTHNIVTPPTQPEDLPTIAAATVTLTIEPESPLPPTQTITQTAEPVPPSPTLTPAPTETEGPPDSLRIEQRLSSLGFYEIGLVDGILDKQTALAIAHFQWLNNLPVTGEFTPDLLDLLEQQGLVTPFISPAYPASPLAQYLPWGMGPINFLSARLVNLGYLDDSNPDFKPYQFNALTEEAVKNFQRMHGLHSGGLVNFQTWSAIFNPAAIHASGESLFPSPDSWDWSTDFYPLLAEPKDLAFDGEYLWVLHSSGRDAYDNTVMRINPKAGLLDQTAPVVIGTSEVDFGDPLPNNEIAQMLFDGNRLWFLIPRDSGPPQIVSLMPASAEKFLHKTFASHLENGFSASALGFDGSRLWATDHNRAWAINRNTGEGYLSYQVGWLTSGKMAFDGRCMWMAGESGLTAFHTGGDYPCPGEVDAYQMPSGQVIFDGQRIWSNGEAWNAVFWMDLKSGVIGEPVLEGSVPSALTFDNNILWVANRGDNTVQGIDPATGSVGPAIPTGNRPIAILREGQNLWVVNAGDRTLQRINVQDYEITIIQPTPSPSPAATLTPTPTTTPTQPPLTRNLYLTTPRMTGDDVQLLQQRLLDLGYDEIGLADGVFGPLTDQSVRQFQSINDLFVDGIVGPITWEALYSGEALGP